jgi:hypothetical protein
MPQRLLRPGIRQSKRWSRVGYLEQTLYIRLLTLVDDYGRYEADPELIRSEAFPYGDPSGNAIPVPTIDSGLLSLVRNDLIFLYETDAKRYLQLTRWKERVRSDSKFPDPSNCVLLTFDSNCRQMIASSTTTTTPTTTAPSPTPISNKESIALSAPLTRNGKATLELMERCKTVLGDKEMTKCHRRWFDRATKHPGKLERVLADMERHVKDGGKFTVSSGARAETLWKEFA